MRFRILAVTGVAAAVLLSFGGGNASASPNHEPLFQLPFPTGETWTGGTYAGHDAAANSTKPIDFNQGAFGDGDLGQSVWAAAAGKVIHADPSSSSRPGWGGYGRDVLIDHGNGWTSRYGHLRKVEVSVGDSVKQGEEIGTVGDSTNNSPPSTANGGETTMSAHLHYEVRLNGGLQTARFDVVTPGITSDRDVSIKSRNTDNDPEKLCGSGYEWIDVAYLSSSGTHQGSVYLLWNGSAEKNCVVTVKHRNRAAGSTTSAYLEPQGATRATDSGSFFEYAGPVSKASPRCVKWGGATGGAAYNSPSEHCS